MDVVKEVKVLVDKLSDSMSDLAKLVKLDVPDFDETVKAELACYMMYLSASDGTVQYLETAVINDLCGLSAAPEALERAIRKNNIYSEKFAKKVPPSLQLAVIGDNLLLQNGSKDAGCASSSVIETYKIVGALLTRADGEMDPSEERDYKIYIDMLETYRAQNFAGAETAGISASDKSSVKAPSKAGGSVSAPRKG